MGVLRELFGHDSATCLEDVVQINLQLVEISLEDVIDLLLRAAQIQLDVFQANFHVVGKLLGPVLHVLVRHKGADHAEPATNRRNRAPLSAYNGINELEICLDCVSCSSFRYDSLRS